ncbi:D-sedoheptulose 7-phosphate isomerase [Nitrosopumilus sp.]|jgi:D-sedoheptulose 7-phosphate isomerase|nr:D-sedoheptulose 7-phosphate isomerase [Nitrosopumilus sp.]
MIPNSEYVDSVFIESSKLIENSKILNDKIIESANIIIKSLKDGNKIITFGNGGSAADAQHIAAELIGRFNLERKSFPAMSLTTDSSILTSLGNDYSYEIIFKRQCESLVLKNDVVIGISTSGNSKNVLLGLDEAKKNGAYTIGLLGNNGGAIRKIVDLSLIVDSSNTARIQETHRVIYHIICDLVEKELSST